MAFREEKTQFEQVLIAATAFGRFILFTVANGEPGSLFNVVDGVLGLEVEIILPMTVGIL